MPWRPERAAVRGNARVPAGWRHWGSNPHTAHANSGAATVERGHMAQSAKKLLKEALEKLPDDATVEEAMERLLFLAKIEQGIAEADSGKTLSHEEVRKRLSL